MELNNLVNKRIKEGLDLLFVLVSDINNGQVFLDKFYVNKEEYELFARSLNENIEDIKSYSYEYRSQKIKLEDLVELFSLTTNSAEKVALIDELNNQLKNVAIFIGEGNPYVTKDYNIRDVVNQFFENREYIDNKTGENFPFELEDLNNKNDSILFRMYNVGQANMSALLIGKEKRPLIIFDLGKSRKCQEAIDLLQNQLPSSNSSNVVTIVISHYDNDHINMASDLPLHGKSLQFIMPEFLHHSDIYKPNIQLLLYRAILNGNKVCFIINESLNNSLLINGYFSLVQGCKNKKDLNQSSDENAHGLIVDLNINGKRLLIPGDALYEDIFTTLSSPLTPNYVIIPHHSCEYNGNINASKISFRNLEESFTFCGPNGKYHHPNKTHFQHYMVGESKIVRLAKSDKNSKVFDHSSKIIDRYYDIQIGQHYDWVIR